MTALAAASRWFLRMGDQLITQVKAAAQIAVAQVGALKPAAQRLHRQHEVPLHTYLLQATDGAEISGGA